MSVIRKLKLEKKFMKKDGSIGVKVKFITKKVINVELKKDTQLFIPIIIKGKYLKDTYVGPEETFAVTLKTYKKNKDLLCKLPDTTKVTKQTEKKQTFRRTIGNLGEPAPDFKEGKEHKAFKLNPAAVDGAWADKRLKRLQKIGD